MKEKYDVIIVGAGPAGLSCAKELQKSDKSVLLVEKNEKIGPKVCAGGLTTKVFLRDPSLKDKVEFSFSSIKVSTSGKKRAVRYPEDFVLTVSRKKLGDLMLSEISSDKIDIVTGSFVEEIGERFVKINGERVEYEYLVGADGSNSSVRKYLGLKTEKFALGMQYKVPEKYDELEMIFDAHRFGSHYAWIFPHKGFTSIGVMGCEKSLPLSKVKESLDSLVKEMGYDTESMEAEGAIINFDYRGFDFGNIYLVGDAAGFTSGITGEGIYFGMASGREVARKIMNPSYDCRGIKRILKIKRAQERVLSFGIFLKKLSPSALNLFFKLIGFCFKSRYFTRFAIRLFC